MFLNGQGLGDFWNGQIKVSTEKQGSEVSGLASSLKELGSRRIRSDFPGPERQTQNHPPNHSYVQIAL